MERMWNRPYGVKFRKLNDESGNTVDRDLEVCPMFIGEQSPIKVDHGMRTTVDGLYAIGDCSYCGSALAGAVPAPPGRNRGSGILNAVFAALQCAASLSEAYTGKNTAEVCMEAAEKSAEELYKPMERTGGAKATDVVAIVQKAMAPVEQSIIMTEERMAKGVKLVEEAKELAKTLCADDWHALLNCREAEAAVLSAEMHYKASAVRKESRGWFMREDYPQMDNKNWLKWVIVQKGENGMEISTEDVPIDKWPVKPQDI